MTAPLPFSERSLRAILARLNTLGPDEPVGSTFAAWCAVEGLTEVTSATLAKEAARIVQGALDQVAPQVTVADGQQPVVVHMLETKVWVENDLFGGRHVVLQHEGCDPFTYASFFYDWRYTSNSFTLNAAETLARQLGAVGPIEHKHRPFHDIE